VRRKGRTGGKWQPGREATNRKKGGCRCGNSFRKNDTGAKIKRKRRKRVGEKKKGCEGAKFWEQEI